MENRVLHRAGEWTQWAEARSQHVVATAVATPLHGSPTWDALLAEAGVPPLSPSERQRHASAGPARACGPSPIEVRRVLEAVRANLERAAAGLDSIHNDDDAERAVDGLKRLARRIVDEQLRRYIASVRPKITTSSIFANALASSSNYGAVGAGMATLACDCCGAPRQQESTNRVCEFCGSTI